MAKGDREYAEIASMITALRAMDPGTLQYGRHYDAIIRRTLPLVEHIARRYGGRGQSHQDLVQVGSIGLVNAVARFDPGNGADFVSFAVPTIMGEVRRHFRDHSWALKVPRRLKDLNGQLTKARAELDQVLQRAPTPSEIAVHLGIDYETVVEATVASANYSALSADQTSGPYDDGMTIQDTFGDNDSRLDKIVDIETIRPLIRNLPAREREILFLRFFDELTQTQIANRVGCSQMQVSRILARTLSTLRTQAAADVPVTTASAGADPPSPQHAPAA